MMESIAAASMAMSQLQFETAYDTAMLKKSMDAMQSEAQSLINMMSTVQAPSPYGFDVYG